MQHIYQFNICAYICMMYILLSSIALQYLHKVFRNHAYLVYIPIDPIVSLRRITIHIEVLYIQQGLVFFLLEDSIFLYFLRHK